MTRDQPLDSRVTAPIGGEVDPEQEQRLEALARLAGKVAHDFNNLLTAISGYAQLLKAELPPDSPLWNDVGEITAAATRATMLTRQLLAFSRKQALNPEACDLNVLVTDHESSLRKLLAPNIMLDLSLEPGVLAAYVDPLQLREVLTSLAVNSAEAMPDGGTLRIETAHESAADLNRKATGSGCVVLTVRDNGVGIEPAVMARIFEPFVTTKSAEKRAGLGLAIAYSIVAQSGGRISLDSTRGQGTTVRISLPTGAPPRPLTAGD